MTGTESFDARHVNLPPIPNPWTGEPWPPAAPHGKRRDPAVPVPDPEKYSSPEGLGPVMVRDQTTYRELIPLCAGVAVSFVLMGVVHNSGFGFLFTPSMKWLWLLLAAIIGLIVWSFRSDTVAAGTQWVQWRKRWVSVYELARVDISDESGHSVPLLTLVDSSDRKIVAKWTDISRVPGVWDLVYNGILHSVASGNCDISPNARKMMVVPATLGRRGTKGASYRDHRVMMLGVCIVTLAVCGWYVWLAFAEGFEPLLFVPALGMLGLFVWATYRHLHAWFQDSRERE